MKRSIALAAAGAICCSAASARAEMRFEPDVVAGYAHLTLHGSDRFEQRDGTRVEIRASVNPFPGVDQLRLGFGLGASGYNHKLDDNVTITVNDGDEVHIFHADQYESVSSIVPEFQLSWRQPIVESDAGTWFIEPGVGVGAIFANYSVYDNSWWSDDEDNNDHDSEWDTTLGVRPFVRAGFHGHRWVFGAEASYLFGGNVDLTDQVGGDFREFFVGGFFGARF